MSSPEARTPLAHREPVSVDGAIRLAEHPQAGLLILRGNAGALSLTVQDLMGTPLPASAGAVGTNGDLSILWLGPDEWLVATGLDAAGALRGRLATSLADTHHQLVEVSDYYTTIGIGGARARHLLSKLVVTDLHPREFPVGSAVATVLAKANVWLWLRSDETGGPEFSVTVRRSHADYVWCLLAAAGREWGLAEAQPIGRVPLHLPQNC